MASPLVCRALPASGAAIRSARPLVCSTRGVAGGLLATGLSSRPRPVRRAVSLAATTPTPATPSVYQAPDGSDPEVEAFQRQQMTAARPSVGEEARTTMALAKHAVLSTISSNQLTTGFPNSSVVEYASDSQGRPILAISTLSSHTPDVIADGRVSLTVQAPSFSGLQDARLTLQGVLRPVEGEHKAPLRELYLAKHPTAFYVDFADFKWFVMEEVVAARYNGGFGNARKLSVKEYLEAQPDPVAQFSGPVCGHMNGDHGEDNIAIVKGVCGLSVEGVRLLDLDRLGMNALLTRNGQQIKARIPFPRPAEDRKSIKEVIVEMTRSAKAQRAASARGTAGEVVEKRKGDDNQPTAR